MTKVHPNVPVIEPQPTAVKVVDGGRRLDPPTVLTVWRKSLLFNCSGFTVFDSTGNLVFRVDNYAGAAAEVLLMDAAGKPLITARRKKMSLAEQWVIYEGEGAGRPKYLAKMNVSIGGQSKTAARVVALGGATVAEGGYVVEGSYCRRSCMIYDEQRRQVAEIRRKEPAAGGAAFGDDVFRFVVMPEIDAATAMAIVVVLDLMYKR